MDLKEACAAHWTAVAALALVSSSGKASDVKETLFSAGDGPRAWIVASHGPMMS